MSHTVAAKKQAERGHRNWIAGESVTLKQVQAARIARRRGSRSNSATDAASPTPHPLTTATSYPTIHRSHYPQNLPPRHRRMAFGPMPATEDQRPGASLLGKDDDGRRPLAGTLGEANPLAPPIPADRPSFLVTKEHRRFTVATSDSSTDCSPRSAASARSTNSTPSSHPKSSTPPEKHSSSDAKGHRRPDSAVRTKPDTAALHRHAASIVEVCR